VKWGSSMEIFLWHNYIGIQTQESVKNTLYNDKETTIKWSCVDWAIHWKVKLSLCLIKQHVLKTFLCLIKHHAIKAYWGVAVWLCLFLIWAFCGDKCSTSRPGRFISGKRALGAHWIGGWVGIRTGLYVVVKRKIPALARYRTQVV
jgi:hypothetical protein